MSNKKLFSVIILLAILVQIGTAAFAITEKSGENNEYLFGNLNGVLLGGGKVADYSDGMIVYSDNSNAGRLILKNVESGCERVLSNDSASYINVIDKNIYYITSDNNEYLIIKTTIESEKEVVLRSNEVLENLFVASNRMYYLKGDSVIEYSFLNGTETVVMANPAVKAFVPTENGIYWFTQKQISARNSEYSSQCTSDLYEGTEEEPINYNCYLFNFDNNTNIKTNVFNALAAVDDSGDKGLESLKSTAKIGNKTIPTAEYPIGSYFTDNGEGCNDHRTGVCGWEDESLCNCKSSHNGVSLLSVQCYAYARYIYLECFGEIGISNSKTSTNLGSIPSGEVTEENFKALIKQAKPGAQIRVHYIKSNGVTVSTHSMIILDSNENGFSVLESNIDGKCGIGTRKLSYSSYVPTLISVDFLLMPNEYPETSDEDNSTGSALTPTDADRPSSTPSIPETTHESTGVDSETLSTMLNILFTAVRKFIEFSLLVFRIIFSYFKRGVILG